MQAEYILQFKEMDLEAVSISKKKAQVNWLSHKIIFTDIENKTTLICISFVNGLQRESTEEKGILREN